MSYTIKVIDKCNNVVEEAFHSFGPDVLRAAGQTYEQIRDAEVRWYKQRFKGKRIVVT